MPQTALITYPYSFVWQWKVAVVCQWMVAVVVHMVFLVGLFATTDGTRGTCLGTILILRHAQLLSNTTRQFSCLDVGKHCDNKSCLMDISIYYNEIVHCLKQASLMCIPCVPKHTLKHYWSPMLDDLKQDCVFAHNIWLSAGRPSSGSVHDLKKNAKYKYKLAIRDAVREFEGRFDDELLSSYLQKDVNTFWKTWKKKAHNTRPKISVIAGVSDDHSIVNKFATYFSESLNTRAFAAQSLQPNIGNTTHDTEPVRNWFFLVWKMLIMQLDL